ncbi:MAG: NAD(P)/FAD-dependent oxidoreductase [Myxococcota bacterium]
MIRETDWPMVLIVGGGFGGLSAAKALRDAPVRIAVIDRQNHHVFQPLLYQVATASLSPADISAPIRAPLKHQKNCDVVLAEVCGVDLKRRKLMLENGVASYDYLVLAAGATHAYFGKDHWAPLAPGLKSLSDATEIRRRILLAFESAEHEADEKSRRAALTFVVVGGGPTGVELSGAIMEVAAKTIPEEFRNIDTTTTRVILVEGSDRILGAFPPEVSERAKADLERLGVEVRLDARVTDVAEEGVYVGDAFISAHNVFWAAGVQASPVGKTLGVERDRAGRVKVAPDCSIPGHPEAFVIGDMATLTCPGDEHPVPGVAQGAMQMGDYVGEIIAAEVAAKEAAPEREPFRYRDKGSMAIIGKNRAVAVLGSSKFYGFVAWVLWAVVHVFFIIGFRNRTRVVLGWFYNWMSSSRDARLIVGDATPRIRLPHGPGFEPSLPSSSASSAE